MGSASTKERAVSPGEQGSSSLRRPSRRGADAESSSSSSPNLGRTGERGGGVGYSSRSARSRGNLNLESALFGLGTREARERDREAERAAREQKRKEREELRRRERERSRREESLDGGFLVTHGVYTGVEDFKDKAVRQLMIERRLAPFWKGLRDHEDNWTDAQLYAAFHDLPIPGPDAEPPKPLSPPMERGRSASRPMAGSSDNLTVPIPSRSRAQSYTSETSARSMTSNPAPFGFTASARSRAKTLSISSPKNPIFAGAAVAGPVETNDPSRFVDNRCLEAALYGNARECPICFLYYPPYLNHTRCCDQDICSECFVQIKRADPHLPGEHDDHSADSSSSPDQLVSEPAACPFCKQPDFGVTYAPPPWRRGISYVPGTGAATGHISAPCSNASETSLPASPTSSLWKRRMMVPLGDPQVVTSDDIRPDWNVKLQNARNQAARRAAAATALHTAAFLMGGNGSERGPSARRLMRRSPPAVAPPITPPPPPPASAPPQQPQGDTVEERLASLGFISGERRRSRIVDLEEMMLMEAIRLSLAEEEQRKEKEERERREKGKGVERGGGGEGGEGSGGGGGGGAAVGEGRQ